MASIAGSKVVVFFRTALDETVAQCIQECRERGIRTFFDIDDYVFEPSIANPSVVDGTRFLSTEQMSKYTDGVRRYRQTLELCDGVIVPTQYLGERVGDLGKPWFLLPNGFNQETFAAALDSQTSAPHDEVVKIGYASGSKTHQKDFATAVRALCRVLRDRPQTVLVVVGELDLDEFPILKPFEDRITHSPLVPFGDLPKELARFDINIAPLEIGNPFCESKSELKYYEAALAGVPTVASATQTFRSAIRNGETGFTATSEDDWYEALLRLTDDVGLRRSIAEEAMNHAKAYYGPEPAARRVHALFAPLLDRAESRVDRIGTSDGFSVAFVLPGMNRGSGGHNKVIAMAKHLARGGHPVTLHFTEPTADFPSPLSVAQAFDLDRSRIVAHMGKAISFNADVYVATYWTTVHLLRSAQVQGRLFVHFMQDYEPYFFPMSTDYLLASDAYHTEDFHRISYGPWVKDTVRFLHGVESEQVPFCIDHSVYTSSPSITRKKSVLFFARPEMPRRCFELGVQALSAFQAKYGTEYEIELFGTSNLGSMRLPFRYRSLGVITPHELATAYQRSAVGLVFSPTNPSMVPFEMMACGLPVIDLDTRANEITYGSRSNVELVAPNPEQIADAIAELLNGDDRRERIGKLGKAFAERLASENETISAFVDLIEAKIASQSNEVS